MSYIYRGGGLLSGLLGDAEIEHWFSQERDLQSMLEFEVALASAQAGVGVITDDAADAIGQAAKNFVVDLDQLQARIAKDGVAPPGLVAQLRAAVDNAHAPSLHKGATSQDLVDTSLMQRLSEVVPILATRVESLQATLVTFADDTEIMAHTRMQRALPVTRAHKVRMWAEPLKALAANRPTEFPLSLGGPEGALAGMGDRPEKIVTAMAAALNLRATEHCWHTDRRAVVNLCTWATEITTALGKFGQDIALMAQNEVAEVKLAGGGTSSAMAHKNNPIAAETLVALARANATHMGGLHQAALHENERSGAGWTLEWMHVPSIFVHAGASTRTAATLIESIAFE